MSLKRTTVTRTDNDINVGADILSKSDRRLEAVVDGTNMKLVLTKSTPHQKHYVGNLHGIEFTSTGE